MLRKNYFILLSAIGAILLSTVLASAQIVNITGKVEVEKEGGVKESVKNALVEIYRTDVSTGNKSDKTDGKGNFKFIGVPPAAKYLLTVSGEGLEPVIINISAGMENQIITVRPGDGTRWTEEQVRSATTNSGGGGELSEEQKKSKEEIEKQRAEYEAEKQRVEQSTAIINKSIKEGSIAFESKNYDLALAKFDEGYKASNDFVGSAPVLLNNKGIVLIDRAILNFNKKVNSKENAEKIEYTTKAKQDFIDALDAYYKSWIIIKEDGGTEKVADPTILQKAKTDALSGGVKVIGLLVRTELIAYEKAEEAKELVNNYVSTESDKDKKITAQVSLGNYLLGAGDMDGAIAAFRVAIEMSPKDPDALAGLGLALYSASFEKEELKQEGLNYMQYFLDVAPSDHKFKKDGSIQGAVDDLKSQKLKPQKVSKN